MELNEFKQVSNPFNIRISENINREKYPNNTQFFKYPILREMSES